MAKFTITLPFIAREMVSEIEQALNVHFGLPMNIEIPDMGYDEKGKPGKARVYYPGNGFKLDVLTGVGHYGRFVSVTRIEAKMGFWSEGAAEGWHSELEKFAGPVPHEFVSSGGEGKLKFVLEGVALKRLQMNASNRRNNLPTYEWNDPNHPFDRR